MPTLTGVAYAEYPESEDEGAACTEGVTGVTVEYEGTAVEAAGNIIVGAVDPVLVPVVPGL